jgi:hypothetical protein
MPVEVITPAENYRLATVDAVRAESGVSADEMDDAAIDDLILQASGLVSAYCRRVFPREEVTETFDDGGARSLILSRTPVVAISEINGDAYSPSICRLDKGAGILRLSRGGRWPDGTTVTYTAGYALPGQEGRNLPLNVERATALLAATMIGSRQRDILVKSESVEGIGRTDYWVPGQGSLLSHPEAEQLLAPFVIPTLA